MSGADFQIECSVYSTLPYTPSLRAVNNIRLVGLYMLAGDHLCGCVYIYIYMRRWALLICGKKRDGRLVASRYGASGVGCGESCCMCVCVCV